MLRPGVKHGSLFVNRLMRRFTCCVLGVVSLVCYGCSFGPKAIRVSRIQLNRVIQQTSQEQMLLNLVRLKYRESPEWVAIPSITAQFSGGVSAELREAVPGIWSLSAGIKALETPTISYVPLQDEEFNRRLLTPVSLDTVALLTRTGWNFNRVLRMTVKNINDVDNATGAGGPTPKLKPEFEQFIQLCNQLRVLQQRRQVEIIYADVNQLAPLSGPINATLVDGEDVILAASKGYQFRTSDDGKSLVLWPARSRTLVLQIAPEAVKSAEMHELAKILKLENLKPRYRIELATGGQIKDRFHKHEKLIVDTCSFLEILYYLAQGISVPLKHVEDGLVTITVDVNGNPFDWNLLTGDLLRVHVQKKKPSRESVAVRYRNHWYYIDDADLNSKSTFNLLLELYNLEIRGGGANQIPLLTIGAGG